MKKRVLSIAVAAMMGITALSVPVMAEETVDLSDKKVGVCIY
mgnify:CR=1 FL=1